MRANAAITAKERDAGGIEADSSFSLTESPEVLPRAQSFRKRPIPAFMEVADFKAGYHLPGLFRFSTSTDKVSKKDAKRSIPPAKRHRPKKQAAPKVDVEFLEWQKAYQGGSRDPQLIENLSTRYADRKDYSQAYRLGMERRSLNFADSNAKVAWDLKVGAWAEADGELLAALKIYLHDHDPEGIPVRHRVIYVKPAYEEGYARVQSDPRLWIEEARCKIWMGDFVEAEALLREAEGLNGIALHRRQNLPHAHYNRFVMVYPGDLGSLAKEKAPDGSPNLVRLKATVDKDAAINSEIKALRSEISTSQSDISTQFAQEVVTLSELARTVSPKELPEYLLRLDRAEEAGKILDQLDALPMTRFVEAPQWIRRAKIKLASGFFFKDEADWDEGKRIFDLLTKYSELEKRKQAVFDTFLPLYPEGSPLVFYTEIPEQTGFQSPWLPSDKSVKESRILQTLGRLEGGHWFKTGKENPQLAEYAREMLADLRRTADSKKETEALGLESYLDYENIVVTGFTEDKDKVPDLAALEAFVAQKDRLFGGTEAAEFFQKIADDEAKDLEENNEGYRLRRDLDEGLATLKDYQYNDELLGHLKESGWVEGDPEQGWFDIPPALELPGPVPLSAKALDEFPAFILNRGESYQEFLKTELDRAVEFDAKEKTEQQSKPANQVKKSLNGMLVLGIYLYDSYVNGSEAADQHMADMTVGPREQAAREKLDDFESELAKVKDRLQGMQGENPDAILQGFREINSTAVLWEGRHTKALLERELSLLKAQGAASDRIDPVEQELQKIDFDSWAGSAAEREAALRGIQDRIDHEALRAEVAGRVRAYSEMGKEVGLSDDIFNGIGDVVTFVPSLINSDWDWTDRMDQTPPYEVMRVMYENILSQIDSENPEWVEAARKKFLRLNSASIHSDLVDTYEDSTTFNQYSVGVGIVIASAMTAGLASGAVAAAGGGTLATGFTNAAVFTLSARVYRGAVYDGVSGMGQAFVDIAKDPLGFTEETLLNWAMFKVIGATNHKFHAAFATRVEKVVANRLAARGVITNAADLSEDYLKANPSIRDAAIEEATKLGESFWPEIAKRGGAFATEASTFQGWEFVMGNYARYKQARFDPLGAARNAFSLHAWLHGFSFLGALRIGNGFAYHVPGYQSLMDLVEKKVEQGQAIGQADSLVQSQATSLDGTPIRKEIYETFADGWAERHSYDQIFGAGNALGVEPVGNDVFTYPAGQAEQITDQVSEHPWALATLHHPNGLVETLIKSPSMLQATIIRMYPESRSGHGQWN